MAVRRKIVTFSEMRRPLVPDGSGLKVLLGLTFLRLAYGFTVWL